MGTFRVFALSCVAQEVAVVFTGDGKGENRYGRDRAVSG